MLKKVILGSSADKKEGKEQNEKYLFAWNNPNFSDRLLKLHVVSPSLIQTQLPQSTGQKDGKEEKQGKEGKEEKNEKELKRSTSKRKLHTLMEHSLSLPSSKRRKTASLKKKRPKWTVSAVRAWKKPMDQFLKDHATNFDVDEDKDQDTDKEKEKVGVLQLYANSLPLAKHSSVFRAMFSSKFLDSQPHEPVEIELESPQHMRAFVHALKFIYTGTLSKAFNESSLMYLFMIAVQFDMHSLLDICTQRLADCLTLQNFAMTCRLLELMDNVVLDLSNRAIHDKCAQLLVENWKRFFLAWKDPHFLNLPFTGLLLILDNKHQLHYATENSMYQILRRWILANSPAIDQLSKIVEYIHWKNISASFFLDVVRHDTCFQNIPFWSDFLQNVQEFMLLLRSRSSQARQALMIQQGKLSYAHFCKIKSSASSVSSSSPMLLDKPIYDEIAHAEDCVNELEDMDACVLNEPTRVFADGYIFLVTFTKVASMDGQFSVKGSISLDEESTGISPHHDYFIDAQWRWEFFLPEHESKEGIGEIAESVPQLGNVHITLNKSQPQQHFDLEWSTSVIREDTKLGEFVTCVRPIALFSV